MDGKSDAAKNDSRALTAQGLGCESCNVAACEHAERTAPTFCPQPDISAEMRARVLRLYDEPANHQIMEAAARVSAGTANSTRVQDTIKFATYMGASRIGIATCTAMLQETAVLARLLRRAGFEVKALGCKIQENRAADLGVDASCGIGESVVCNPIMQALLLNEAKCDLNILMGICVGHDALFAKYSDAPAVTLVAKDFLAANNPCAVLYTADSVYKGKLDATVDALSGGTDAP